MNCSICSHPILLTPSAAHRARQFGGVPSDYIKIFTEHATCVIAKRAQDTHELIKRTYPK